MFMYIEKIKVNEIFCIFKSYLNVYFVYDQNDLRHVPNRQFEQYVSDFDNAIDRNNKQIRFGEEIVLLYKQHIYSGKRVWVKLISIPIEVVQLMFDTY